MKIRHRIVFNRKTISIEFVNFLEEKKAKFSNDDSDLIVAYLFEEENWKNDLYQFLQKEGITSIIECIYSKAEIEKATWFSIRSKFRWEYPQPKDYFSYRHITYDSTSYCDSCGYGLKQKEEFRINKSPKWGKRNFLMLNWVHDELFINNKVRSIMDKGDIKGYKLHSVLNVKTNKPIDDINQIYIEEVLQPGLINKEQSIKEVLTCRKCGTVKYIYTGRGFTYKKDVFEGLNTDIVKSSEMFGDGLMSARLIFISKNLYKLLISNSLDKDLVFEPIAIV